MKLVQLHTVVELLLTTLLMSFMMSGMILLTKMGFSSEMLSAWIKTFPVAWLYSIPAIMITKKIVRFFTYNARSVQHHVAADEAKHATI